jgi:hypothetical protein
MIATIHGAWEEQRRLCTLPLETARRLEPSDRACSKPMPDSTTSGGSCISSFQSNGREQNTLDRRHLPKAGSFVCTVTGIHARISASTQLSVLHRGKITIFVDCITAGKAMVRSLIFSQGVRWGKLGATFGPTARERPRTERTFALVHSNS